MGNNNPSVPNPVTSATQGIQGQIQSFPFQYLIDALSQTGGSAYLTPPNSTTPQLYNFSGLGTSEVQNELANQMAQVLLSTQQNQGGQFINQSLQDLSQADPTGTALYSQLSGLLGQESGQAAPDMAMAQQEQGSINDILQQGQTLTPEELMQVQQGVRGQQAANGITLGNAPTQQESDAVINALDAKQNQAQNLAGQFLTSGVNPSDLQYAQLQRQLSDLGAFQTGQSPLTEMGTVQSAGYGAAPYTGTNYTAPTVNEGQAGLQGINNAMDLYNTNLNWSQNTPNPYLAGLSTGISTFGALA